MRASRLSRSVTRPHIRMRRTWLNGGRLSGLIWRILVIFALRNGIMFRRGDDRIPIYRMRQFDDAIMESPRIVRATLGRTRELNLKRYDVGYGDYESCCRAVNMLCELWREAPSEWFTQAVITVSQIAGGLTVWDGLSVALSRTYDVEYLDGSVNPPNLIAWCAVCAVKGGTSYDCCMIFDSPQARNLIIAVFKNFDRLDTTRYTDSDLKKILLQGR
nr:MAG TPA: hypothetical protein [Caudoviricetes sp.]